VSYLETRVTLKVYTLRCDACGNPAGEPATTKEKALALGEKRWGFVRRQDMNLCSECSMVPPPGDVPRSTPKPKRKGRK
jgi:hypothetical protein